MICLHCRYEKFSIPQLEFKTSRNSLLKHAIDIVKIVVNDEPWSVWIAILPLTLIKKFFVICDNMELDKLTISIWPTVFPFSLVSIY